MRAHMRLKLRSSFPQACASVQASCSRRCCVRHSRKPAATSDSGLQTPSAVVACSVTMKTSKRAVVPAAAAPSSSHAAEHQHEQQQEQGYNNNLTSLEQLLVWLVNNGVTGIGLDDSKVELYEAADGDRGVLAAQDISAGEQLLRVPLRLAITDVMDEEQKKSISGAGALWQDRLVAKLLQQVQAGRDSPWYPYIQALPKHIPSALDTFTESDADAVQLPAVVAAIKAYSDKITASWQSCLPDSISEANLQTYRWAHTVVMSRTFGNASQAGGIGVRMLVPLIDMLNHAADESDSGLLYDVATAKDNVRWDVVSPDNSPNNCWEMLLSSTRHIAAETALQLSYFVGANDEFLLHYGFVPRNNPHDTLQLFSSVTAALEHCWQQDLAQGKSTAELRDLYIQALDAGLTALQQEVAAAAADAGDADWGPLLDALEPIKIASGSRVSGSLIAALEVLNQGDMAAVDTAVASLAWQQQQALPTHLLCDLALLVADAQQQEDEQAVQLYGRLLRHYSGAMVPEYAPELHDRVREAAASNTGSNNGNSTAVAATQARKKKKAVPGPPPTAAASQPQTGITAELIKQLPLEALMGAVSPPGSLTSRSSTVLSYAMRTAVKFRVSKKMLLADVVLAAKVPYGVLQQQTQLQQRAASAASPLLECGSLPWQQTQSGSE